MEQRAEALRGPLAQGSRSARRAVFMKGHPEERARSDQVHREAGSLQNRLEKFFELGTERLELLPAVLADEHVESSDAGGHGNRIARQRTRLIGITVRGQARPDLARTTESTHRHTAANDLTEGRQIGNDPRQLGNAAPGETKA